MRLSLYFPSGSALDTAKITSVYEYELINNLYSRLVEYDQASQLVPGVAESFSISEDSITFQFGKKVQTIDGHFINAEDAAISLKRLVMLGKSGHGDIRRMLCPGKIMKSIDDVCPGIQVDGNKLILKPVFPHYIPLLVSTLESADYSIIPKTAIDLKSTDLRIIDFRNTSGPYYIFDHLNIIKMKANPGHFHFNPEMPQEVNIIPTPLREGPSLLLKGDVDMITTAEYFAGKDAELVLRDRSKFNIHSTQPFRIDLVCFSTAAIKNFSVEQRLYAAKRFTEVKKSLYQPPGSQDTVQFFQVLSDGTLSEAQLNQIIEMRESTKVPQFERPIKLGINKENAEKYKALLSNDPNIQVVAFDKFPFEYDMKDRPDMYGISTDSAWTENLSLLGHNFGMGIFQGEDLDPEQWFKSYLSIKSKEGRIQMLNKLHFDLLKNVVIFPMNSYPYYAATNKDWKMSFSKLSSNTDLWQMRRN